MSKLVTARLQLRPLGPDDETFYCRLYCDPALMRHVGAALTGDAALRSFHTARRSMEQSPPRRHLWVLVEQDSNLDVGLLGLECAGVSAEVGALVEASHQDRGYAAEAIAAIAGHAFLALGLTLLHTRHDAGNGGAAGLMRKLGFALISPPGATHCRWQLTEGHWRASRIAMPG